MARKGWRAALGATIPALGGLVVSTGCSDVFGFEHSASLVDCVRDSDCGGTLRCLSNRCVVECGGAKDCEPPAFPLPGYVCIDSACVAKADAAVNGPSEDAAREEVLADSGEGGTIDAFDTTEVTESGNIADGGCPQACALAACIDSHCVPGMSFGLLHGDTTQIAEGRYLTGVQIQVPECGYLVGIGFALSVAAPPSTHIRLGLYKDDNGPTDRLAQTAEWTINGLRSASPIEGPPVLLGCDGHSTHWLFFATDAPNFLNLEASSTTTTWLGTLAPPNVIAAYLSDALPVGSPWGGSVEHQYPTPVIYLIVVQTQD
jgi:hypothetical protein